MLKDNEAIERLGDGVQVIISPDHGFGTDAFLLMDFADVHRNDTVCDLGTGCGIIPMLLYRNGIQGDIYGVDIQEKAIDQFKRALPLNDNPQNIHPILADLKDLPEDLPFGKFKVVLMNPPYNPAGTGDLSRADSDKVARHETECTTEDILSAAKRLLNFGGRLVLCSRPERLTDVLTAFRSSGIEPKHLRLVQKDPESKPWLFLLSGTLGGKPYLNVDEPLYIQDKDGTNSEELKRILGSYTNETEGEQ